MSVRINLEIGHEASIRTKATQEGFTHDWEVFVRGCDHTTIQYYVEKVVFHLHETFTKPKRVVKEPPYSVKESGYAGFNLPIEIHLRNKDEPKKIFFNYDLNLQQAGPAIYKVQKEKYIFNSPNEEFKAKLLKGGGAVINSPISHDLNRDNRSTLEDKSQLISKPRLGGSDYPKKHKLKLEEQRAPNSFQDLFGPPITKMSKTSFDSKSAAKDKNSNYNKSGSTDKDKPKSKHSPHKEKEKLKDKGDSEKKSKEDKKKDDKKEHKDKEDKSKEKKEKRERSPKMRSPTPTKRLSSPKRPPTPTSQYKQDKKIDAPKEKKTDEKEKEKKSKKEKKIKDKDRKEKHKDSRNEQKENKTVSKQKDKKEIKDREISPSSPKPERKEKSLKEKDVDKDSSKEVRDPEPLEKPEKIKNTKSEDRPKHKHKKKDKDKKEKNKLIDKEKIYKSEKKNDKINITPTKYDSAKETKTNEKVELFDDHKSNTDNKSDKLKKPLNLLAEFADEANTTSSNSSHDDLFNETKIDVKKESTIDSQYRKEDLTFENIKLKKEKVKKNKEVKADKEERKRKRKSDNSRAEEPVEKFSKTEYLNSNVKPSSLESTKKEVQLENDENEDDYMNVLRDLQQKILTLEDNAELQKVVQLIAETGRFEVSAQTFDFDLCLLERSTIKQLQNFFESSKF